MTKKISFTFHLKLTTTPVTILKSEPLKNRLMYMYIEGGKYRLQAWF